VVSSWSRYLSNSRFVSCSPVFSTSSTDRQIIARRELIIRWGRRAQNTLRVPHCLRIFADTEPGMLDGDIRGATVMALGTGASINIGLLALFLVKPADKLRNWLCFGLLVIYPVGMILVEWFALVLSRRRLERRPASFDGKGNHAEGDKSIRDSIAWLAIYG